jgi:hypothetical protein
MTIDLPLRPEELLAAWRAPTRRLVLAVREPLQPKTKVALRISVTGAGATATITGKVLTARRDSGLCHVDIAPDDSRARALERLLAIAAGERVVYHPRAPRYLASVPAVVNGAQGPRYMTTFAVSENGCGLSWSGPMPDVGSPLELRLGAGSQAASFLGEVCWTSPMGRAPAVGVHFAAGERSSWTRIIADLRRTGAPPA